MIHHDQAAAVIAALDIDPRQRALLERYIRDQRTLDEGVDPVRRANAAERRADRAIAVCGTLTDDLRDAVSRIVELEDQVATMMAIIIELSG